MSVLRLYLNNNSYTVSYCEYGIGNKVMLVYPGFGQKKEDYEEAYKLFPEYRFFVFDHFNHGESSDVAISNDLIPLYLLAFDELFKIQNLLQVEVLGFSIGTRVAAIVTSNNKDLVSKLTLIAPDVAPEPFSFRLVMHTPLRFVLQFAVHFPWFILVLIFVLKKYLGSPFTFYYKLWKQKKYRKRLLNMWSGLRNSRQYIDWEPLRSFVTVYTLRDEDILDNEKIRSFYVNIGVEVKELPMSHYAFPKDF